MDGDIIRCPSCGKANRIPLVDKGKKAVCGSCKTPLDADRQPLTVTDANFKEMIAGGPIVVDFWAGWCGPCHMIAPVIAQLAAERTDIRFGKLNVDENPQSSRAFHVQGIPLLIFFRDGVERGRVVGAVPRAQIEAAIAQYFG
jgi:thioredoxin